MNRFSAISDFKHDRIAGTGILLTNLGTPDAPTTSAVRRYLREFLSDPRVVEIPRPLWWLILNGLVLPTRPRKSAAAYRSVWMDEGSPLLVYSKQQAAKLQVAIQEQVAGPVEVALAMRYGNPSIKAGLEQLREAGAERLLILPLYPQYCSATTGSTFDAVSKELKRWRWVPELRMVGQYHDFPAYIDAMASEIETYWSDNGRSEFLLFSYHGLPKRNLLLGDPYHCQCQTTTRLLAARLGLAEDDFMMTFQSRFGKAEWLKPYTNETLKMLPGKGQKNVDVYCPGFSADCLETIEEIGVENRDYFLAAGGEQYRYIPALNAEDIHVSALLDLIRVHTMGWPEFRENYSMDNTRDAATARLARAQAMMNS